MRKRIFLCLYLATPLFLAANEYPDRGVYGNLDFLYTEDEYTMASQHSTKENFIQELKVGYGGNIYSPRLLDYTVEGALRYDTENFTTDGYETKQKTVGEDYRVDLKFIKDTKFPFTLYANRQERPVSTVYSVYSVNNTHETSGEGASGVVDFAPYTVTYGANKTRTISESSDVLQESQSTNYNTSFRFSENKHSFQASYVHNEFENEQHYINDEILAVDQMMDTISISDSWYATDDLRVYSNASYENDEVSMNESINGDFSLYLDPKDADYDGSLSVYGSKMEYDSPSGGEKNIFNSVNINQTFNYKLTESILLSENAMAYIYDATSIKGVNSYINLYATHNYATIFFETMPFTLVTRVGAQRNDTKYDMTVNDSTTPTSISIDKYNLDLQARVNKSLPSIDSTVNFYGNYYNTISSMDETEQRYALDLYLLTKLFYIVNNNLSARYMQSDRSIVSVSDGEKRKNSYSTTSLMEALDFSFNLGFRGKIRFLVGAEYLNRKYDDKTESSVNPRVDANMNYRLFQNWNFSAQGRVSEMYNTVDHSGSANLNFRAGKTTFLVGYQYNKSQVESVLKTIQNERALLRVQLTRTF